MQHDDYLNDFARANSALRGGRFDAAQRIYASLPKANAPLSTSVEFNANLANRKLLSVAKPEQHLGKKNTNNVSARTSLDTTEFEQTQYPALSSEASVLLRRFGSALLGPILALFYTNIDQQLRANHKIKSLRFLAREGFVLKNIYDQLCALNLVKRVNSTYLLCSRTILFKLSLKDKKLWDLSLNHHYKGRLVDLLKQRYQFNEQEIDSLISESGLSESDLNVHIDLPKDSVVVTAFFEKVEKDLKRICGKKGKHYSKYLKSVGYGTVGTEHLVDIGYAGTIQKVLSSITGTPSEGHYFLTTRKAKNTKTMRFRGHILEGIDFGDGHNILDRSLLLETVLTAPHGQVIDIEQMGKGFDFKFGIHTKTQQNYHIITEIVAGATNYVIAAMKDSNIMTSDEINSYLSIFLDNSKGFPELVSEVLEIDDHISGLGIVQTVAHFNASA